jgi:hypothetical protein
MNNITYHLLLLLELITFRITYKEYKFRKHWHMDPKVPASYFWETVVEDPEPSNVYDAKKGANIKVRVVPTKGVGGGATRLITQNREHALNLKGIIDHDAKQLRAFEFYDKWIVNTPQDPMLWESIKMRSDKEDMQKDQRYGKEGEKEEE